MTLWTTTDRAKTRSGGSAFGPIVFAALWMAGPANLPLWRALWRLGALDGAGGLAFGAGFGLAIAAMLTALASLFAWRATLKPVLMLLLLAAAFGAHFMWSYGIVIDPTMMINVVQTDMRESSDLVGVRMLVTVALLGVLPALLVWRWPVRALPWSRRLRLNLVGAACGVLLTVLLVVAVFQPMASTMRNHKQVRYLINPLNSIYALGSVAFAPLHPAARVFMRIGEDAQLAANASPRPPLFVLVIGETARSDHFSLNGYARQTNPELAREDLTSLRQVRSCGTSTAASLPCMFSHLGRVAFDDRQANHENLLDVLQRAGLAVLWLDNQAGCKGVCDRVPSAHTEPAAHPALCDGGECQDLAMLEGLEARLGALPAEARARGIVLVMHPMGSHGPAYYKRSPPALKRFRPECTSAALQDCSREQVVNAYDNSIVATDRFLAATIGWLKARAERFDTALLYVSDHGESLGENNLYLHGLPYAFAPDAQKHVPWIQWSSEGFARRSGVGSDCLRGLRETPLSHDNLFHTMLGALDVRSAVYQRELDAYRGCRAGVAQ